MSDYKPLACLPVLPLRGIVVYPGSVTNFDVGRSRSARAVEEAMRADQMIFLVAQRDVQCDEPKKTDLYSVGTVAYVRQILRLPGDNMRILVEGKYRAQLTDMIHAEPYLFARAMELDEPGYHAAVPRTQALVRQARQLIEQYIGPEMVVDDEIALEWARIPHFYYDYYVYQYATGYAAAIALSRRILREGEPAVKDYLGFLSGGCSADPITLLRGAGVDMASPKPIEDATKLFDEMISEMEKILN